MKSKGLKISLVGSVGLPPKYGGWETFAAQIGPRLSRVLDVTVYCCARRYTSRKRRFDGAKLVYIPILDANGFQSIFYDLFSMLHAVKRSNAILVLGVSGAIFFPFIRLLSHVKIITNIDGLEWKRAKWGYLPGLYLRISEYFAVKFSHKIISDNDGIRSYVKEKYGVDSELIEYGADHVDESPLQESYLSNEVHLVFKKINGAFALSVCRIEPENNIDIILDAFSRTAKCKLIIVGNWESSRYSRMLRKRYSSTTNLILMDALYDNQALRFLRQNCKIYIHGHSVGGTNPSLLEAMQCSCPVIAYDCVFNRFTTENEALYFVDERSLVLRLNSTSQADLASIGQRMGVIARRRYTWASVGEKYLRMIQQTCCVNSDKE